MLYSRVTDAHLKTAVDVMTDMVFAPTFNELDSVREVVLEEIAMYRTHRRSSCTTCSRRPSSDRTRSDVL